MNFKLIMISAFVASALMMLACGGSTTPANSANKPANAPAVNATTPTTNTNATNTAAPANSTAAAPAADGSIIKLDDAGIMMTVPKGMDFSKEGEDTVVKTADGGIEVRFSIPKDGDYEKAIGAAAEELDSYLDNVKIVKKGDKTDVNGMEGTTMSGTAKDSEGDEVEFELTIIKTPKKPVLATVYAEKASIEKHGSEVAAFIKTIKKL
jgi:hypothetical protein